MLINHVKRAGHKVVVVKTLEETRRINFDSISHAILSGGPKLLTEKTCVNAWSMNMYVLNCFNGPVLGVCFGMQIMTINYGGSLKRLDSFQKGKKNVIVTNEASFVKEGQYTFAYNDATDRVPCGFKVVAYQGTYPAAMVDRQRKRYAVQFHPESGQEELVMRFIQHTI